MRRPSVDQARALLESDLLAGREALAGMTAEDCWPAFVRFGRRRFDLPDSPDVDGILFQYGTYACGGPPTFTLDLTRQFDVVDSDGDHDHYVQLHCELRHGPSSASAGLGSFTSWFFHDADGDVGLWARGLTEQPAWTVIRALRPTEIRVYQTRV
ncbi:hypothetical protein V2S66_15330 [Streptomyces sp. V4-01]|uniref:Uncharacterized protein n=1 Tax=Actinacidiphila polyblastidii TaxID=3110430 RepID=A0ABU7PE19_9ACTN|nr:hypothetical protein [Streptomyces sp. V4-01]